MTTATKTRKLVWTCHYCQKPIPDGKHGYITIQYSDIRRVEEGAKAFDEAHPDGWYTLTELISDFPEQAAWVATHFDCDPHREKGMDYWFDVERARTPEALLDWTLHLMETKAWLEHTDWPDFIRKHLAANGKVLGA